MQRRTIIPLKELSDRNLLAPNDRLLHGARPVARVEGGVILELLQPRTKPLIRVVKVVRNTRTEHVQEGKTLVLNTLLDQIRELFLVTAAVNRVRGLS